MHELMNEVFTAKDAQKLTQSWLNFTKYEKLKNPDRKDKSLEAKFRFYASFAFMLNDTLNHFIKPRTMVIESIEEQALMAVELLNPMNYPNPLTKYETLAKRIMENYVPKFIVEDKRPRLHTNISVPIDFLVAALSAMLVRGILKDELNELQLNTLGRLANRGYGFDDDARNTVYASAGPIIEMINELDQQHIKENSEESGEDAEQGD